MEKKTEKNEKSVLRVVNLTKQYGSRNAIDRINFSIKKGEIFGFVGANGAGKSTTMKIITGLAEATSGDVFIDGKRLSNNFEKCIAQVGSMIETPLFYPYLTGFQNLKYFAKLSGSYKRSRIIEIANLVGLTGRLHEKVQNYSLGMKQRLGIAQSLLHNPKLLILDEPTNGLDANGIREIKNFLVRLAKQKGVSIMISSHILAIMESLCDTICIIDKGKIVETKTIDEIKKSCNRFGTHFIRTSKPNFAGMIIQDKFNTKARIAGDKVLFETTEKQLPNIIVELTHNKIPIYSVSEINYSLEDIYLDVIGTDNAV
ncbi:MAG: ABC transporter ATP-binding protein [Clostridia bacterium]|nr:ABC transporter ATP-binding protein [Clostridia bacterium]